MIKIVLLLALLFAPPAWAQDELRYPDGEDGPTDVYDDHPSGSACSNSTACSATTCETDVDESPASLDALEICTETANATIRFTLQNPASNPSTATNAQTIDVNMTCTDADTDNAEDCNGNPTFSVELYCGTTATGVLPFNATAITATDQGHNATFTYPAGCATDGSDLEFQFTLGRSGGSPGGRRWAAINAVEWEVTYAPAGGARRRLLL